MNNAPSSKRGAGRICHAYAQALHCGSEKRPTVDPQIRLCLSGAAISNRRARVLPLCCGAAHAGHGFCYRRSTFPLLSHAARKDKGSQVEQLCGLIKR
jgi:hypothetical protein